MIGPIVAFLAGAAIVAGAQDAVAPTLTGNTPPPAQRRGDAAAQALPSVITICIDRTARQCWTVGGASRCESPVGAEVFDTLSSRSPDLGSRLRACVASATR